MTQRYQRRRARRLKLVVAVALLASSAAIVWLTGAISLRFFLSDLEVRKDAALAVQSGALERLLDKFRLMTPLTARRPDVADVVERRDAEEGGRIAAIAAGMSGAKEVWFLSPQGETIATSDASTNSGALLGRQWIPKAFREAAMGQLGRQLIPGNGWQPASYVFASPIRVRDRLAGVVAVRVRLDDVEQAWALSKDALVALDENDVVVVTNVHDWRGTTLRTDTAPGRGAAIDLLRAGGHLGRFRLVRPAQQAGGRAFLELREDLPVLGWKVVILSDVAEARTQSANAMLIAFLLCVIGAGAVWSAVERREGLIRRLRSDRAAALRLERRVRSRTIDLTRANQRLEAEIEERLAAEAELRRAQAELVQAAKLATLGHMSAALSHEYNQPLAAIRTNAENATLLIARGEPERATESLARIGGLVARMAEIARTLKGFTRRAGTDLQPVSLRQAIDEALLLLTPQVRQQGIRLTTRLPDGDLVVLAGRIRLEQVIMNLVANAIDAVRGREDPAIDLDVDVADGEVRLSVADNGTGIPEVAMGQIFDPFFTTKDVGAGLGLGLSIAYKIVHDFSGSLTAENRPEGGARFVMRLPLAQAVRTAAE
ncbi:sensor histidine kinase [Polymorphum gilvum]|uniref:C4-dicarboxylate transport sensor protein DctB n=1 Tax=Polymorphum gilvum (strain LMG 25793 / CGMCC 1.9160 / SL003B-26A1) TaxID=991905 RepID=F2IVT3_POLGS|nr:ATP-binding protein [Polymorphum gilvum]ADZ69190.1 Probable two-component sensor histidine kinase protein [Polymorphum gilvum SL003B-26A1]